MNKGMYTLTNGCDPQVENIVELYMEYIGYKTDGVYVEVGGFDGFHWSNTYDLAMLGWTGLVIEPNPEFAAMCRRLYQGTNVTVFESAAGAYPGIAKLYLGGSTSTLFNDVVYAYNEITGLNFTGLDTDNYIKVNVETLDDMYGRWIGKGDYDLLVIDVEGAELDVLRGYHIDWYRPKMAIVETHKMHPDQLINYKAIPICHYFKRHGYDEIQSDTINSVFVRR